MRIRIRRRLTPTLGLGAADHQLLTRLRAAAILLDTLTQERGTWSGEIFLSLYNGQLLALGSLSRPVILHIAATAGIALDPTAYDTYPIEEYRDLSARILRVATQALVPGGLPPGLGRLLRQVYAGMPVPPALVVEVEAAGWILSSHSPILWPKLDEDLSAHELLDQVAASGILDPEGAALLGPLARFVAEAVARLTASGGLSGRRG